MLDRTIWRVILSSWICSLASAQTAALAGRVTDSAGAAVVGATVTIHDSYGTNKTTRSAADGSYSFSGLEVGNYTVEAAAPDLSMARPASISIRGGSAALDLQLNVAATAQQVTVTETAGPAVSMDPGENAGAIILRGNDLAALSENPDDLAADLQALAGPSAGPNGGQLYVDGFTAGQLPPKDSIREIRINSNPFSPEFDTLGYGRIQIFTKPGADKLRGSGYYNFSDSFWNSRNPYAAQKAPFELQEYGGNVSGPMGKRASFQMYLERDPIDNGAIINGSVVDPQTLAIIDPYTQVFRVRQRRWWAMPRIDYQLNEKNTLSLVYYGNWVDVPEAGVGGFNLLSEGYDIRTQADIFQAIETMTIGANVVNQTRFQFYHVNNTMTPLEAGPTIQVLGSFSGGASAYGKSADTQDWFELHSATSIVRSRHTWKFGGRFRGGLEDNISRQNFGGAFTFSGGVAPELDANNQLVLDSSGTPVLINISSIEQYRRTLLFEQMGFPAAQIRALGGGAAQFVSAAGNPEVRAGQFDLGVYTGDDWRVRPNVTLSLGLRYETQTNIHDARDFAPRVAVAWGIGGSAKAAAKTVIRAGSGIFYDRFALTNTLTALRYNGAVEQQYIVTNPDFFPMVPPVSGLGVSAAGSSVWEVNSHLRAPYTIQSTLGVERQLPRHTTLALTFANSHGLHLVRSADINAPLPGTYNPTVPGNGVFPYGRSSPIFLMESAGLYNQNQFIMNINSQLNKNVSVWSYYVLNHALSNTDGLNTFPANPYSMAGEYGPASTDVRHHAGAGGSIGLKWNIRVNTWLHASSGPPFDITVGEDLYGDTLFNGRSGITTDPTKPGVIATKYGLLDPNPTAGEATLPRNYGRGPGMVMWSANVTKTIPFGPPREGSQASAVKGSPDVSRRYNFYLTVSVRNVLNHNNPGPIIGNIASPEFGLANQPYGSSALGGTNLSESANNRRVELQGRFTF